jgi:hypothetical protein
MALVNRPRADVSLVTVARFAWPADAEVAKGALEAAGIEAYLTDDQTVRMDWLAWRALGGIKLRIRQADWNAAEEILTAIPAADLGDQPGLPLEEVREVERCQECNSIEVARVPRLRLFAGIAMIIAALDAASGFADSGLMIVFGIAIAAIAMTILDPWRCLDCGSTWR